MHSFTSNSVPTTYCAVLRILNSPGLVDEIRHELETSGFSSATADDMPNIIPSRVPLLRSCMYEAMRMHTVAASVREVLETTDITVKDAKTSDTRTYRLKKGNVINMPSVILHYNEQVNPNPMDFTPKRFVPKELEGLGQNTSTSTRGFGGGTSYCPGRIFAERQIIGCMAVLFWHFDVSIANEDWEYPISAEFDAVGKTPRVLLDLKKRRDLML